MKWLSGMLRWQRVVGLVRDVFKVTVYFCVSGIFGESVAFSPFIWTRSEKVTSVSRAGLRSDRHSHFLG